MIRGISAFRTVPVAKDYATCVSRLAEGEYDVKITDHYSEQWVRGLVVPSGGAIEQNIEVTLKKRR